MNRDEILSQKTPKQLEIERLAALPTAPYVSLPPFHAERPHGVLLSDQIEFYCKNFKLLDPYKQENIKAANYELRVGLNYAVAGKSYRLNPGDLLTIPKFEVAVIEILETINMPRFMIGRWNIRTKWAYEGLIWVGGPQIDAGFRGILPCPIWNLSNHDFSIKCGEEIAIIDFEFTTPVTADSQRYPWETRSRFLFEDYDKPRSALVTDVELAITDLKQRSAEDREMLDESRTRIDSMTAVMLTALGILTAAITIFATKPTSADQYWWDPTVLWLAASTTVLALLAFVKSRSSGRSIRRVEIFAWVLASLSIGLGVWRSEQDAKRLRDAKGDIRLLQQRVEALERVQTKSKP